MLCNEVIDFIHFLGNKMYDNINKHDMTAVIGEFYLRNNSIIANFIMCDSVTLNNLHSTYCSSLYGNALFNSSSSYMSNK